MPFLLVNLVVFNLSISVQIEAIMNDFIQLEPQSNLFEAETMMEGAYFQHLLQGAG